MSSAYANVIHQHYHRRNFILNRPIQIEREVKPEYKDDNQEHVNKNKVDKTTKIHELKKSLKINDTIAALLSMIGLIFAIVEYEDYFKDDLKPHFQSTPFGNIMRSFVSLSTMILLIFLYGHSQTCYKIHKEKYSISHHSTFLESKHFKYFLIEAFINIIHTPPGLDVNFQTLQLTYHFEYSLSTLTVNWMLLRFYLVFRLFALYSGWTGSLAESCCGSEGCEANTIFATKAVLKNKPYETILIIMIASIIIFGLAIRNFERPLYYGKENEDYFQDYSYIWNGMWLIAVTMTTVGYGDLFPRTHLGRFVVVLACFWGVFLVSMMVVTLTVSSSFETKEAKAYDIVFRLNVKNKVKNKAAKVGKTILQLVATHKQLNKKKMNEQDYFYKKIKFRSQLHAGLEDFKNAKTLLGNYDATPEELLRQLTEKTGREFEEIKEILFSITATESQLEKLEKSQQEIMTALNECVLFTNTMQTNLIKHKKVLSSNSQ